MIELKRETVLTRLFAAIVLAMLVILNSPTLTLAAVDGTDSSPDTVIVLGYQHSAAIRTDGSLWMWGANYSGELGDGTTTNRLAPVRVMEDVVACSLGLSHSAAIKKDGTLWL